MTTPIQPEPHPDHDRGLEFDLSTLLSRRRSLGMFLGAGAAAALAACTPGGSTGSAGSATASSTPTGSASSPGSAAAATPSASASPTLTRAIAECGVEIPEETAGPFPGDGSNGPNALSASGVVRQDITASFGTSTSTAAGVPLTVTLTLLDNANGCTPLAGAAIYAWHCDRDGRYSMYDSGLKNENYLRGVQEADANGQVTFTTIYPGAYSGRWPHIHFEVFESMNNATTAGQVLAVSQIALTDAACREVYASAGYESSARNFPRTTLKSDNVFGDDGGIYQLATMGGSVSAGYTAALNVTI
ncbi:protocatechuate 3,4-dioxygenase beta subunit [Arthrobacter sp. V4I6]|uniref:intradiol ring-cleavage dioxygenase n=1 Tax=unclassified Arthrobacter TaxID=235627 RepID=UPI00278B1505|nr:MULTISPECIES: intradiol ring-cleavage dioxygenase [unclassified Arthrobacter]MDQ0823471.1 protocatechuate 3,4-dioxygenase beta subunit [Arthrobacter sp. V1I7]MDQ0853106.1 protocatechuate 3,4-dioxygenase beta subunit [Arthrobacter sp. V4I6]